MKKIFLSGLAVLFIVLKFAFIFSGIGVDDESLYSIMARLVSQGLVPYRDFFFAHPPLALYANAVILKLSGFGFAQSRILPFVCSVVFLFAFLRLFENNSEKIKALALLFTSMFFVQTSEFMFYSAMTAFSFLAVNFYLKKNYFTAGFFIGLSFLSRVFAFVPLLALLFLNFKNRKNFLKILSGFLAVVIPVCIIFEAVSGNFIYSVFLYHSTKPLLLNEIFLQSFFVVFLVRYLPFLVLGFPVLAGNIAGWKKLDEKQKLMNLWLCLGLIFIVFSRAWNTEAAINLYTVSIFLPFAFIISKFRQYEKLTAVLLVFWFASSMHSLYTQAVFDSEAMAVFSEWHLITGNSRIMGPIPSMTLANFPGKTVVPAYLDMDYSRFNAGHINAEQVKKALIENSADFVVVGGFNSQVYPWKEILDYCCVLNSTKKVFSGTELETVYSLYYVKNPML